MDEVEELKKCIKIEKLTKYGYEMYESKSVLKELERLKVNIICILNRYYIWYDLFRKFDNLEGRSLKVFNV